MNSSNPFTIINALANCTTAISAIALLVHIFGDPTNSIWDNKIKAWLAKVGLTVTICGSISNALTLNTPATTEILLNCGISLTFFWLSWWQFEQFKYKMDNSKKKPVRRKRVVKSK